MRGEDGMRCSKACCENPPFWGLLIWLKPGLSVFHWCTMIQQCSLPLPPPSSASPSPTLLCSASWWSRRMYPVLLIGLRGFSSLTEVFFCLFYHFSCRENWFSMHKQSLLEEGECIQTSDLHLTVCWVGVQLCFATKFSSMGVYMVPPNKARQKKTNAHGLPISISLCAGWVSRFVVQPKFYFSFISLHGPSALLW